MVSAGPVGAPTTILKSALSAAQLTAGLRTATVFAALFLVVYVTRALLFETRLFAGEGLIRAIYLFILVTHTILAILRDTKPGTFYQLAGIYAFFADKNAGAQKPVMVSEAALGGADAGNYALAPTAGLRADITPRPLDTSAVVARPRWRGRCRHRRCHRTRP